MIFGHQNALNVDVPKLIMKDNQNTQVVDMRIIGMSFNAGNVNLLGVQIKRRRILNCKFDLYEK